MTENIHTAMLAIMADVSYIQKEKPKDGSVNYTLKTENGVIGAIRPAMLKHGVYMFPAGIRDIEHSQFEAGKYKNIWNRLVAVHVYRFVHAASGTSIDVEVLGDGADTGDKAGNKSMTTSKKYALLEAFLLETGDDPDTTPSSEMTRSGNGKQTEKKEQLPNKTSIITADAWDKFIALVTRAQAVQVPVPEVERAKTTIEELRAIYKELDEHVKNAEAQAVA